MADYLEKQITKKRTGANLLGINVDTRAGLTIGNPATEYMLNALEKIAQKAEKAEIDNAKQSFWLDIEERNLKLQNKLSDPNIYGNQESFEEAMKEIENQRKENEKLLAGNMYFTKDEKELAKKQLNNGSFNIYAKAMEKRNTVYTQQQVEKAVYEMDRLVTIGSQLDMNDVESQKMIVDRVIAGTKTLQSLGNWTDERAMEYANRNMMAIEQGRFKNQMDNIINSQLSLEQKKSKMQQLFNVGNNANNIKAMAQSYTDRLGYTGKLAEESVKYFEASIKNVYDNVKGQAYKNLERYEKEIELAQKQTVQLDRKGLEDAIYKNDAHKFIYYASGKQIDPTTQDLLYNNNNIMSSVTNLDITDFGDVDSPYTFPYITSSINSNIKQQMENIKQSSTATYQNIYSPVYTMADELSGGNLAKRNAILKNWALENKIHPTVILEGEQNPDMFRVSEMMKKGNDTVNETEFDINNFEIKDGFSQKYKSNFNKISAQFSNDKILGDRLATNFLIGYIVANNMTEQLKDNPEKVLKGLLKNDMFSTYENDIRAATQFTSKAKDYHYIKLGQNYIKQPKEETNIKNTNSSQRNVFWEE